MKTSFGFSVAFGVSVGFFVVGEFVLCFLVVGRDVTCGRPVVTLWRAEAVGVVNVLFLIGVVD